MKHPMEKDSDEFKWFLKRLEELLALVPAGYKPNHPRSMTKQMEDIFSSWRGDISFEWDLAWAVGCSITIRPFRKSVILSWSATSRTVPEAIASADLYMRVAKFGAMIESFLGSQEFSKELSGD